MGDGSRAPNRARGKGPGAREERGEDDDATLFAGARDRKDASCTEKGGRHVGRPEGTTQRRTANPKPRVGQGRMVGKQKG